MFGKPKHNVKEGGKNREEENREGKVGKEGKKKEKKKEGRKSGRRQERRQEEKKGVGKKNS